MASVFQLLRLQASTSTSSLSAGGRAQGFRSTGHLYTLSAELHLQPLPYFLIRFLNKFYICNFTQFFLSAAQSDCYKCVRICEKLCCLLSWDVQFILHREGKFYFAQTPHLEMKQSDLLTLQLSLPPLFTYSSF